jgi:pyruvate dehydrogenase E2 component (dihydrolipoamide acetyltransferase)
MAEIVMPRLSDTMEEGTILSWLVADGEQVSRGQELVEIETDKANMTYESDQEGVLAIVAAEGDTLPVGAVIAQIGGGGGDGDPAAPASTDARQEDGPASRQADARTAGESPESEVPSGGTGSAEVSPAPAEDPSEGERVKASPLAKRIASERGVDLHTVTGTGPGGRIVKADVPANAGQEPVEGASPHDSRATPPPDTDVTPSPVAAGLADVTTAKGESTVVELSRTQQTIARRMAESKATIPHFALQSDVDMEACVALRAELKSLAGDEIPTRPIPMHPVPMHPAPTYNDMVIKACALALREFPTANSSYRDGRLQLHSRVNVGMAVAADADEPAGGTLIVPTVFDADQKSLGEIARETRALAARVREHSITPPELGGGTFTVSNLGMFGTTSFTAIINPPQAAILSVGSLERRAVVRDGEVQARNTMTISLACDHRILYGAPAARFLARIRELLEVPAALTL